MPEPVPAPEAPPTLPLPAAEPPPPSTPDLTRPPPPKKLNLEDDPDLLIKSMIARRGERKAKAEAEKTAETPKPGEEKAKKPDRRADLEAGDAIARALGFRMPKPKEGAKVDAEGAKVDAPAAKVDAEGAEPDAEGAKVDAPGKKTTVTRKPPTIPAFDAAKIAREAATAATREALNITARQKPDAPRPEDLLSPVDRNEYDVAKHLAESNPKYKDAPRQILEYHRKATAYADRWEAENKGKVYNPDDSEHDDFYATHKKPWSESEFASAERDILKKQVKDEVTAEYERKFEEIIESTARAELVPIISQAVTHASAMLAKAAGDEVLEALRKEGFEALSKKDPIVAEELSAALQSVQPMIETMIQLDDPRGRVKLSHNNEMHVAWSQFLQSKEAEFAGEKDGHGRTFATRLEYREMSPAERASHWFLTVDHLVSALVNDSAKHTAERIKTQKDRIVTMAEAMGYVPRTAAAAPAQKAAATKSKTSGATEEEPPATIKPVSPSSGNGVPSDNKTEQVRHGVGGALSATHDVLFSRS